MRPALTILVAAAALLAGCGGGESSGDEGGGASAATEAPPAPAKPRAHAAAKGRTVKLVRSQFGRILGDAKGQAFYLFAREKGSKSRCYGACAKAWPPVITKGTPRAGKGARNGLLGTTKRRDGKVQVTYRGHPLYYYEDDSPGRVLCHNVNEFGGLWLVVKASGAPVA